MSTFIWVSGFKGLLNWPSLFLDFPGKSRLGEWRYLYFSRSLYCADRWFLNCLSSYQEGEVSSLSLRVVTVRVTEGKGCVCEKSYDLPWPQVFLFWTWQDSLRGTLVRTLDERHTDSDRRFGPLLTVAQVKGKIPSFSSTLMDKLSSLVLSKLFSTKKKGCRIFKRRVWMWFRLRVGPGPHGVKPDLNRPPT